jgi:polyisoprenyl-teichoic acid--peptidoglycan teichoic acid transferase
VADSKPTKPYRTYRGGRAGRDDPEAARFDFSGAGAGTAAPPRPRTPEGLRRPDARPDDALPGRRVAVPGSPPPPTRRTGIRGWPWRRIIGIGIPVILLLFIGWLYLGYRSFSNEIAHANKRLNRATIRSLKPAGNILTSSQISLIMGSDSRGTNAIAGARSDSILLVRTDPSKHLISMLSIPRDLDVPIAGHGTDKINASFAFGGPPLLIRTVDKLTGLGVNHVVLVDFTGFKDLIDSLGGVTVNNPWKIVSSQPFDGLIWHFAKGTIHLDGRHALAYARIRHTTNPKDSDITREERQQRVVSALMHKLVSPSTLFNLPSIGSDIAKPLATDLSAQEILAMGWLKYRASRTLECHLGGTPESIGGQDVLQPSDQNAAVIQMFLGNQAPQPPARGQLFGPGCTIH